MTPSNSANTRELVLPEGSVNSFRYQPMPVGRNAPAPVAEASWSNGPEMLQSCGRFTCCQAESSNCACSAPWASPLKNRQLVSKGLASPKDGAGEKIKRNKTTKYFTAFGTALLKSFDLAMQHNRDPS